MPIRLVLSIVVACALSACVSIPERVDLGAIGKTAPSFEVVDKRPASAIASRVHKTAYSDTYHLGDETFTPSRLSLMVSRLQEKLGDQLRGQRVEFEEIDVWVFHSRRPIGGAAPYVPSSGSLGADLIGGMLGMLVLSKLGEDADVQIRCTVRGSFGGSEFSISEHETAGRGEVHEGVKRAVLRASDTLVAHIEKLLVARPEAPPKPPA